MSARRMNVRGAIALAALAVALWTPLAAHGQELFPPPPPGPPGPLLPQIPRDTLVIVPREDHGTLVVYGLRASGARPDSQQTAPAVQSALVREKGLDAALAPADGVQRGGVRQLGRLGDAALHGAGGASATWSRDCYAIDIPECDARIVFLDTRLLTAATPTDADRAHARLMLARADSAFVVQRRFRFLVIEQPLFGAGTKAAAWADADSASFAGENRRALLATCERRHVSAVLAGGERLYQRLWVTTSDGGFWHVTTGGAGRSLDKFRADRRDLALARPLPAGFKVPAEHVRTEKLAHYLRIEMPHKLGAAFTAARFDVYAVRSKTRAELFEHLDLEHGP